MKVLGTSVINCWPGKREKAARGMKNELLACCFTVICLCGFLQFRFNFICLVVLRRQVFSANGPVKLAG